MGKYGDSLPFWPWKSAVPPPSHLQTELGKWNLVCTHRRSLRCVFWGSRLFSPISSSHSLTEEVFWSAFHIFLIFWEFVPRITSLQIKQGSWNWVYTLSRGSRCAFWGSRHCYLENLKKKLLIIKIKKRISSLYVFIRCKGKN